MPNRCSVQICLQLASASRGFYVMSVESHGFGKFSSNCVLVKTTSKQGKLRCSITFITVCRYIKITDKEDN